MKNTIKIFIVVLLGAIMTSCIKADDISVLNVNNFNVDGISKLTAQLKIENRSSSNITLLGGRLNIYYNDKKMGEVSINPAPTLLKHSVQDIDLDLNLNFNSPIAAYNVLKAATANPERLTISGEGKLKAGCLRKSVKIKDMPVSNFISNFVKK